MWREVQTYQHKVFFIIDILQREKITVTHCPIERMIDDHFTKPQLGNLFTVMRDIIMRIILCPAKERIGNKMCTGTECKEIKFSTSDREGDQVDEKSTVPNATSGTD